VSPEESCVDVGFNIYLGDGQQEDVAAMLKRYPLIHGYWEDKRAQIDRIKVPAYILASFSTMLHTEGSFRGFEDITHSEKW
jgi:predicted acyl esterase